MRSRQLEVVRGLLYSATNVDLQLQLVEILFRYLPKNNNSQRGAFLKQYRIVGFEDIQGRTFTDVNLCAFSGRKE